MDQLYSITRAITRITIFMLAASFMAIALFPEHSHLFYGAILGLTVGQVNTSYLARKVRKLTEMIVSQENKRFSFGFLTRVCYVLLAFGIALELDTVSQEVALVCLFIPQLLTIPVGIVVSLRNKD